MRFETLLAACFAAGAFAVSNPHKRAPKKAVARSTPETLPLTKRETSSYLTPKTKSKFTTFFRKSSELKSI